MKEKILTWLLESAEPWTRYRTWMDLCGLAEDDARVKAARLEMLSHPQVQVLIHETAAWPETVLQRHNDAHHPLHKLSTLADFGLRVGDGDIAFLVDMVMEHISEEGMPQSLLNISPAFGGSGENMWGWIACDAPVLLYALASIMGCDDSRLQRAAAYLANLSEENGWRCFTSPTMGKFHGPGRRCDPCPITTLYALKALAQFPGMIESRAARQGVEMLLGHWEMRKEKKYYLFGVGGFYR